MNEAYLALGTNIEPRFKYLRKAIDYIGITEGITIRNKSSIYETIPVGYKDQADFLNMVIQINTSLPAIELLEVCQSIERKLGRKRGIRFGPRTIDLDILIYNQEIRKTERLTLPHPRMHERAFVLVPLKEVAKDLNIPVWNKSVNDLLGSIPEKEIGDVVRWTTID